MRAKPRPPASPAPSKSTKILKAPLIYQSTPFSCGAAALLSVFAYYGLDFKEQELMTELGTCQKSGTDTEKIVSVAIKNNIKSYAKDNVTVDELRDSIDKGNPVIVEIQAWQDSADQTQPLRPYKDEWESGHDVVVIGVDKTKIYFMDPSLLGTRGFLPLDEFMIRWHDLGSKRDKKYQTAIFFEGTPDAPRGWELVE